MDSLRKPKGGSSGVYTAVHPTVRITDKDLYVPRFLSAGFFQFLSSFCRHPFDNAIFMKEWRRNKRRLGPLENHLKTAFCVACLVFSFLGLPLMLFIENIEGIELQQGVFMALYLAPSFIGGLLAFLTGLSGGSLLNNQRTLDDLRLTPLTIPEIVFGQIIGSVIPFSLLVLALLPGLALVMLYTTILNPVSDLLGPMLGCSMVIWVLPNTVSTMIYCAAISSAVSYSTKNTAVAMSKAGAAWLVISIPPLYMALFLGTITLMGSFSLPGGGYGSMGVVFLFQEPILILYKVAVACAFLQHLSQKLANLQALEQEGITGCS
jgi:hypothetical protein